MEQGKTRKDRILAVVRRVKAQEPEIQAAAKSRVRKMLQEARLREDGQTPLEKPEAVTSEVASSPGQDRR